ncbi:6-phosphogluconolactonase [Methylobacterium brachiatum]|nr:6-phosphogluconolactonase [Methylobacterium brachiatum]
MFAFVGSRTTVERKARGAGLSVYTVLPGGTWELRHVLRGLTNPSYLALSRAADRLYAVHGDGESVSAFAVARDGALLILGTQATEGRNPVHLLIHERSRSLLVANYATGSLVRLPIHPDGTLGRVSQSLELPGQTGPHRTQQTGSHPHQVLLDPTGDRVIVPDKGLDRVFAVAVGSDDGSVTLAPDGPPPGREGAGPRHAVFDRSGTNLFVANELDSTVTRFAYGAGSGRLSPLEIVSTLPSSCLKTSHAAGIALTPCGRWLYVSNRGDDSIAVIEVEAAGLRPKAWIPAGGAKPRFITLDPTGQTLLVANEDSDTIVSFAVDQVTGALARTGQVVETGSPVCVVFGSPAA